MNCYLRDRDDFMYTMGRAGVLSGEARRLLRYAASLQRLAVTACNRELSPAEERRDELTAQRVREVAKITGIEVQTSGDPRGACVKVRHYAIPCNSWGGEGWHCVPTRKA